MWRQGGRFRAREGALPGAYLADAVGLPSKRLAATLRRYGIEGRSIRFSDPREWGLAGVSTGYRRNPFVETRSWVI